MNNHLCLLGLFITTSFMYQYKILLLLFKTRHRTIIINLPGSKSGVAESLDALFPWLLHAFKMMEGEGH